jgi:hypothetical protein
MLWFVRPWHFSFLLIFWLFPETIELDLTLVAAACARQSVAVGTSLEVSVGNQFLGTLHLMALQPRSLAALRIAVTRNRQNWHVLWTRFKFADRKSSPSTRSDGLSFPANGRLRATASPILAAGSLLDGKLAITIPHGDLGVRRLQSPWLTPR